MSQDLLSSISEAVKRNIPHNSNSRPHKILPGWTDYVSPFKDRSIFWKSIWVSAGRPLDNDLHRIMKATRNKYHYAVRKIQRLEKEIRKSKFLQSCLEGDISDIFSEIKRVRNKHSTHSRIVDGYSTELGITDNFKRLYADIYNVHADFDDLDQVFLENNNEIGPSDLDVLSLVDPELVTKIINKFHSNKNDSYITTKSNAFKHGVKILAEPICDLLRCMLIHGFIPKIFLFIMFIGTPCQK